MRATRRTRRWELVFAFAAGRLLGEQKSAMSAIGSLGGSESAVSVGNAFVSAAVAKVYTRTVALPANVAVTVKADPSAALISKASGSPSCFTRTASTTVPKKGVFRL